MKILNLIPVMLVLLAAEAQAVSHKFVCEYDTLQGSRQTVTFEGPADVDLEYPDVSGVPLRINGSSGARVFAATAVPTHTGVAVTYSSRDPFFVNDIQLRYNADLGQGETYFRGTWTTDAGSPLKLECEFVRLP